MTDLVLRPGRVEDADILARLVNYAGEGLPLYLWEGMREGGETAWDVGRRRAARESGSFTYRNAIIAELGGQAAGCIITYALPDAPEPIAADMPAMFRPLQELENLAPGTRYINVLAVPPEFRNMSIGTKLLEYVTASASDDGCRGFSIIVSDANMGARRLYGRSGFEEIASRPMVKEGWENDGSAWVLLIKNF